MLVDPARARRRRKRIGSFLRFWLPITIAAAGALIAWFAYQTSNKALSVAGRDFLPAMRCSISVAERRDVLEVINHGGPARGLKITPLVVFDASFADPAGRQSAARLWVRDPFAVTVTERYEGNPRVALSDTGRTRSIDVYESMLRALVDWTNLGAGTWDSLELQTVVRLEFRDILGDRHVEIHSIRAPAGSALGLKRVGRERWERMHDLVDSLEADGRVLDLQGADGRQEAERIIASLSSGAE